MSAQTSDSTLRTWTDPDSVATSLNYDASKRLTAITNRAGDSDTIRGRTIVVSGPTTAFTVDRRGQAG